jgi:hypothetical protein
VAVGFLSLEYFVCYGQVVPVLGPGVFPDEGVADGDVGRFVQGTGDAAQGAFGGHFGN